MGTYLSDIFVFRFSYCWKVKINVEKVNFNNKKILVKNKKGVHIYKF